MYFVYILKSEKDGSRYVGITQNMKKRLEEHNNGTSIYTKGHMPWRLIWCSMFPNQEKAAAFEVYLKSGSGIAFMNRHLV
ncbi:MAG: endonuclease [Candidatus Magasanikbacteria bacterium CG10_big_fil_rev_8_21_14_0_10_43_9]|nr:MAG: endonuclease [Candidatus Magasanikbacteria bacterium CG10_big_fil_rev_8_21_14_0_10_43_9]